MMHQKIKRFLVYILPVIGISTLVVVGVIYSGDQPPSQNPPLGNVAPPITTSTVSQYKEGALGIGGVLRGWSNAIFDGNVGIGTTGPSAKLDVAGQVKITGGGPDKGKVLTSDTNGLADWQTPGTVKNFTVVMAMNSGNYCPPDWNKESVSVLKGINNYLYIHITDKGLLMAGSDGNNYGHEYLYARIPPASQGINYICHKTFLSSSGNPHASVLAYAGNTACPENYYTIPRSDVWGNSNHHTYFHSNSAGLYIGWLDNWAQFSQPYNDDGGWMNRYTNDSSQIDKICLRVMGVDDDSSTKNGVFPVFLGLKDATQCPSGFNSIAKQDIDGSNNIAYLSINQSTSILGGLLGWNHGGDNFMAVSASDQVNHFCYKYLNVTYKPFFQLRTPNAGNCQSGYWSFDANKVKGTNNHGYFASTGHGVYLGGLNTWALNDFTQGFLQQTYINQVTNKFCLRVANNSGDVARDNNELVNGMHSIQQCTSANGSLVKVSDGSVADANYCNTFENCFCQFRNTPDGNWGTRNDAVCPSGWMQYKTNNITWTETTPGILNRSPGAFSYRWYGEKVNVCATDNLSLTLFLKCNKKGVQCISQDGSCMLCQTGQHNFSPTSIESCVVACGDNGGNVGYVRLGGCAGECFSGIQDPFNFYIARGGNGGSCYNPAQIEKIGCY